MAIKRRTRSIAEFNTSAMSDLVFLLLIFFMITSTLIAPNAIKLLLPQSSSRTMAKQTLTVYINKEYDYLMDIDNTGVPIVLNDRMLEESITASLTGTEEGSVVLRSEKTVPVQYVVNVIDIVNRLNNKEDSKHKVILATSPKK